MRRMHADHYMGKINIFCPSVACAARSNTGGFADALPRECKVFSLLYCNQRGRIEPVPAESWVFQEPPPRQTGQPR